MKRLKRPQGISPWYVVIAIALWIVLIVYCWMQHDVQAAELAVILPTIFGTAFLVSLRVRSMVLGLFMALTFISHGIAPAFFFLQRDNYTYTGGFGAVKNFSFGVGELLEIYGTVFVFTFSLLAFAMAGIAARKRRRPVPKPPPPAVRSYRQLRYDVLLVLFVVLVGIPQSLIMYSSRVGITGLVSPVLPYRLTGLMYYSRAFFYPVLLFVGFMLSKQRALTASAVLLYAWFAGMCGSSRYLLLISAAAVPLFALIDRKRIRFVLAALFLIVSFRTVTYTRAYVYDGSPPFREYAWRALHGEHDYSSLTVGEVIGGIALRLYGPQDIVLSYQYDVPSRAQAVVRWFTGGNVVEDLNYDFYGMTFAAGSGFGVGIGLHGWMIVLARRSYILLVVLAAVIALLLVLGDAAVDGIRRLTVFNASALASPVAFFLVYVLYASSIRWYYQLLAACFLGVWALRFLFPLPAPFVRRPHLTHGEVQAQ